MSGSAQVRIVCACHTAASPSFVDFRFATAAGYDDGSRIYWHESHGIEARSYMVDRVAGRSRPVDLPDPDQMPPEGFHIHAGHFRYRLECSHCGATVPARSTKLGRLLYLRDALNEVPLITLVQLEDQLRTENMDLLADRLGES